MPTKNNEEVQLNPKDMTDEQTKVLESVYSYKDTAEITDEDYKVLMASFPNPNSLRILRKVLGILTRQELGLLYPVPDNHLQSEVSDDVYKFNHQLQIKVDESIRSGLANLYLNLKSKFTSEQRKAFEVKNTELAEEKKAQEKIDEKQDANARGVGELL